LYCSERGATDNIVDNFFLPAEESDRERDDAVLTTQQTIEPRAPPVRLPNPLSGSTPDDDEEQKTSVFTNYYHRAEEAKLAVLEHHVKLTSEQLKTNDKPSKRHDKKSICINFQQGRCRFGTKCRFAHSISSETAEMEVDVSADMKMSLPKFGLLPSAQMPLSVEHEDDEDSYNVQKKRKHKSGVTDTLMPPKRAMKTLDQQRKEERPWTVTKR